MSLASLWQETIAKVQTSPILHGAISTGKALAITISVLLVLAGITYILRRFFHRHEGIRLIHRFVIYLLTMVGVLALLFAGVVGIMLPVIPGVLFLLLGFILLRRYYKYPWVDHQIRRLNWRLRFKRGVRKAKRHIEKSKIGKALRKHQEEK